MLASPKANVTHKLVPLMIPNLPLSILRLLSFDSNKLFHTSDMDRTEQDTSGAISKLNTKGTEAMDQWKKDSEKGIALMKDVVTESKDSLGPDNPFLWIWMNNLAYMYDTSGLEADAGQLRNEVILAMERRGTGKSG
jgi:hypothetical protein